MTTLSTRRRIGVAATAVAVLVAPLGFALPAYASSTANEIVYTVDDNDDGLYGIVIRDLGSRRVTTVLPADTDDEWLYDDPELSPTGDRVAFVTDRGSSAFTEGIAVVGRDGAGFRRITNPPAPTSTSFAGDFAPAWSPDGSRLLFTRVTLTFSNGDVVGTSTLFTVPAAGGTPTAVPNTADGYLGDWSPDGQQIVYAAASFEDDQGALTVIRADGTGKRTLGTGVLGLMPQWSPDGATIAYTTITSLDADRDRAEDIVQIATVPAAGGTPTVLAGSRQGRSAVNSVTWSPDGESLLFDLYGYGAEGTTTGDLWAIDRAGTRAGRLAVTPGDEAQVHAQGPTPTAVSARLASTYTPVTPGRILDTRNGTGAPAAKVGPAGTVALAVRGVTTSRGPVPANASAVVLNVTVTAPTARTDVRAYPSGAGIPQSSNVNALAGETVPNLVTVSIGADGAVVLRNSAGSTHLIADIAGYYTPDTAGIGFTALAPQRILDTRAPGVGAPGAPLGATGFVDLAVTGTLRTADGGTVVVPSDARAVVLNVTGTGPTAATDIRAYPTPAGSGVPTVSNLNLSAGQTAANLVTVAVGESGKVRVRNLAGSVNVIADIAGYYAPGSTGRFVPVVPTRFLDTRSGIGGAPIPTTAQAYVDLRVAGTRGVPADATAAVLNLTGTGVTTSTDVRGYPVGAAGIPTVSNLNLTRGATRANLAIVKTGTAGQIRIRNTAGQVDLIGDLAGYMVG